MNLIKLGHCGEERKTKKKKRKERGRGATQCRGRRMGFEGGKGGGMREEGRKLRRKGGEGVGEGVRIGNRKLKKNGNWSF